MTFDDLFDAVRGRPGWHVDFSADTPTVEYSTGEDFGSLELEGDQVVGRVWISLIVNAGKVERKARVGIVRGDHAGMVARWIEAEAGVSDDAFTWVSDYPQLPEGWTYEEMTDWSEAARGLVKRPREHDEHTWPAIPDRWTFRRTEAWGEAWRKDEQSLLQNQANAATCEGCGDSSLKAMSADEEPVVGAQYHCTANGLPPKGVQPPGSDLWPEWSWPYSPKGGLLRCSGRSSRMDPGPNC